MPIEYPSGLLPEHHHLFTAAATLLSVHFVAGRHEVASAILLSSGEVVLGLHLEGSCGRSSICAEGMALGASLIKRGPTPGISCGVATVPYVGAPSEPALGTNTEVSSQTHSRAPTTIEAVVAVLYIISTGKIRPIAPCGVCRELLFDYCPDATCYTWTASTTLSGPAAPMPRQERSKGFDLDHTELAEGRAQARRVDELLPGKTRRVGW